MAVMTSKTTAVTAANMLALYLQHQLLMEATFY